MTCASSLTVYGCKRYPGRVTNFNTDKTNRIRTRWPLDIRLLQYLTLSDPTLNDFYLLSFVADAEHKSCRLEVFAAQNRLVLARRMNNA